MTQEAPGTAHKVPQLELPALSGRPRHVISVDVEDYFQVEAFADIISSSSWSAFPSRVVGNTHRILDLFDEYGTKGTFFFVGWVGKQYPALVREVVDRGHELACHSYWHRAVYKLTPQEFREDTRLAVKVLEDAGGVKLLGYRAPTWSITNDSMWALEILAEEGFAYDSSIYPIAHDLYGVPHAPRLPYRHALSNGQSLIEFPPATIRLGKINLPAAGGGYLRIFPLSYTRWVLRQFEQESKSPAVIYFHPWEIDTDQPKIEASLKSQFRHYTKLNKMEERLTSLLQGFRFRTFCSLLSEVSQKPSVAGAAIDALPGLAAGDLLIAKGKA